MIELETYSIIPKKLSQINNNGFFIYNVAFKKNLNFFYLISLNYLDNKFFYFIGKVLKFSGKVNLIRKMGSLIFIDIIENSYNFQLIIKKKKFYNIDFISINNINTGDILGVCGFLYKTKNNVFSLDLIYIFILSKCFFPLPEKWHGLKDVELRYRNRFLDLFFNKTNKNPFLLRSKIISLIRCKLDSLDFLEVETPVLVKVSGGASSSTFNTYHEFLNSNLILRIATELSLKKIISCSFSKIYEIGKIFRNESVDSTHNPEFTSIEFYQTYVNYKDNLLLIENIIKEICFKNFNSYIINFGEHTLDFNYFSIISIESLVLEFCNLNKDYFLNINFDVFFVLDLIIFYNFCFLDFKNFVNKYFFSIYFFNDFKKDEFISINNYELLKSFKKNNFFFFFPDEKTKKGFFYLLIGFIYENKIEKNIKNPTFIYGFSYFTNPLAKINNFHNYILDRFELIISGIEIANLFTELIDPYEQYKRFKNDSDTSKIDFDFLNSLLFSIPPLSGAGIGIDRLSMIFSNSLSIKEVIFFPFMKS